MSSMDPSTNRPLTPTQPLTPPSPDIQPVSPSSQSAEGAGSAAGTPGTIDVNASVSSVLNPSRPATPVPENEAAALSGRAATASSTTAPPSFFDKVLENVSTSGLTDSNLRNLTPEEWDKLPPKWITKLSPAQINELDPSIIARLSENQFLELTSQQFQALTRAQIAAMTPTQIGYLNDEHFEWISIDQLRAFTHSQVDALSDSQLSSFLSNHTKKQTEKINREVTALNSKELMGALTVEQIRAMTPKHISSLTPLQLSWLTDKQFSAFEKKHIDALTPEQVRELAPKIMEIFSLEQRQYLSKDQFSRLSELPVDALKKLTVEQLKNCPGKELGKIFIKHPEFFAGLPKELFRLVEVEDRSFLTDAHRRIIEEKIPLPDPKTLDEFETNLDEFENLCPLQWVVITEDYFKTMPFSVSQSLYLPNDQLILRFKLCPYLITGLDGMLNEERIRTLPLNIIEQIKDRVFWDTNIKYLSREQAMLKPFDIEFPGYIIGEVAERLGLPPSPEEIPNMSPNQLGSLPWWQLHAMTRRHFEKLNDVQLNAILGRPDGSILLEQVPLKMRRKIDPLIFRQLRPAQSPLPRDLLINLTDEQAEALGQNPDHAKLGINRITSVPSSQISKTTIGLSDIENLRYDQLKKLSIAQSALCFHSDLLNEDQINELPHLWYVLKSLSPEWLNSIACNRKFDGIWDKIAPERIKALLSRIASSPGGVGDIVRYFSGLAPYMVEFISAGERAQVVNQVKAASRVDFDTPAWKIAVLMNSELRPDMLRLLGETGRFTPDNRKTALACLSLEEIGTVFSVKSEEIQRSIYNDLSESRKQEILQGIQAPIISKEEIEELDKVVKEARENVEVTKLYPGLDYIENSLAALAALRKHIASFGVKADKAYFYCRMASAEEPKRLSEEAERLERNLIVVSKMQQELLNEKQKITEAAVRAVQAPAGVEEESVDSIETIGGWGVTVEDIRNIFGEADKGQILKPGSGLGDWIPIKEWLEEQVIDGKRLGTDKDLAKIGITGPTSFKIWLRFYLGRPPAPPAPIPTPPSTPPST